MADNLSYGMDDELRIKTGVWEESVPLTGKTGGAKLSTTVERANYRYLESLVKSGKHPDAPYSN
jgi:hypothetical protein